MGVGRGGLKMGGGGGRGRLIVLFLMINPQILISNRRSCGVRLWKYISRDWNFLSEFQV
jgi:hypothetical protein